MLTKIINLDELDLNEGSWPRFIQRIKGLLELQEVTLTGEKIGLDEWDFLMRNLECSKLIIKSHSWQYKLAKYRKESENE